MKKFLVLPLIMVTLAMSSISCQANSVALKKTKTKIKIQKTLTCTERKAVYTYVDKYAKEYGVDKKLIHAIIMTESNYDSKAKSHCGAVGLMQLMPRTARAKGCTNLYDPEQNVKYGTQHIAGLLAKYHGNEKLAVAAYNVGGGCVDRNGKKIPSKAKHYVNKVMSNKQKVLNG